MEKDIFRLATVLAFCVAAFAAIPLFFREPDIPDPKFLARDLYFQIGNEVITAPVVAVGRLTIPPENADPLPSYRTGGGPFGKGRYFPNAAYKSAMIDLAADRENPAVISGVSISIGVYSYYGENTISTKICPLLTNDWSQNLCRNEMTQKLKDLPRRFHLATDKGLEFYRFVVFSGLPDQSGSDLIEAMGKLTNSAKLSCTVGQEFCIVGVAVSEVVFATWGTSCRQQNLENCEQAVRSEGAAVIEFFRDELGLRRQSQT